MVFSCSKSLMLFTALGTVSVLALPVPDAIDINVPTVLSTATLHVRSEASQEKSLSKRMDHGYHRYLEEHEEHEEHEGHGTGESYYQTYEPPTSASGPISKLPPYVAPTIGIPRGLNCPLPPPGGRKFRRRAKAKDRSVQTMMNFVKNSHVYHSNLAFIDTNLFGPLEHSMRENLDISPELIQLLNAYYILVQAGRQVNDELARIEKLLEENPTCSSVYAPWMDRIRKKCMAPWDMIYLGLADPENNGASFLEVTAYDKVRE
ncbi:hypothetical protein C8R42DRAFT_713163 [Lentinula raphanica]|nr:hypothetical protein C8R42DRAFT_713163 [Lentinula raphanica]